MTNHKTWRTLCQIVSLLAFLSSCAGTGTVAGNDNGSSPINNQEKIQYEKTVVRCLKTGGTRVVKIMGKLRCY